LQTHCDFERSSHLIRHPYAGKLRVELGIVRLLLAAAAKYNRDATKESFIHLGHKLNGGRTSGNDQIWLTSLIFANIPVAKLFLRSLIVEESGFQIFTIELDFKGKLRIQGGAEFIFDESDSGSRATYLAKHEDAPGLLNLGGQGSGGQQQAYSNANEEIWHSRHCCHPGLLRATHYKQRFQASYGSTARPLGKMLVRLVLRLVV